MATESKGNKAAVSPPVGGGGAGQYLLRKGKNPFEDLTYIAAVNERNNANFGLFENYQINPYTRKTLDFITPKVNERYPNVNPPIIAECVPGYSKIKEAIEKWHSFPQDRYCEIQTEAMRLGWFEKGEGYYDRENYDDRFKFSHQTAEFIKVHAEIKEHDRLMKLVPSAKLSASITERNEKNPWRI